MSYVTNLSHQSDTHEILIGYQLKTCLRNMKPNQFGKDWNS